MDQCIWFMLVTAIAGFAAGWFWRDIHEGLKGPRVSQATIDRRLGLRERGADE